MSQTFSLVCPSTQKRIWLGQGWGEMTNLYSGQQETMEALKRFLNDHIEKPVYFVCDDETGYPIFEWDSYDEEAGAQKGVMRFEAEGYMIEVVLATRRQTGLKEGAEISVRLVGQGELDEFNDRLRELLLTGRVRIQIETVEGAGAQEGGRMMGTKGGIVGAKITDTAMPAYALMIRREEVDALRAVADAARMCVEKIDRQGREYPQDVVSDIWDWLTSALKPLERLKASLQEGGG